MMRPCAPTDAASSKVSSLPWSCGVVRRVDDDVRAVRALQVGVARQGVHALVGDDHALAGGDGVRLIGRVRVAVGGVDVGHRLGLLHRPGRAVGRDDVGPQRRDGGPESHRDRAGRCCSAGPWRDCRRPPAVRSRCAPARPGSAASGTISWTAGLVAQPGDLRRGQRRGDRVGGGQLGNAGASVGPDGGDDRRLIGMCGGDPLAGLRAQVQSGLLLLQDDDDLAAGRGPVERGRDGRGRGLGRGRAGQGPARDGQGGGQREC